MRLSGNISEKGFETAGNEKHMHAGHIVPRVWVVVADQEKARFWRKQEHSFHEIGQVERHSHSGHGDTQENGALVKKISGWLEKALDEDLFDRIILVASPRVMGAFHDILPKNIRACITAEIPKDLTHFGPKELETALEKIVVI